MNIKNLNSFLTLGYFLDYPENNFIPTIKTNPTSYAALDEGELITQGKKVLLEVFDKNIGNSKKHLVPLSGGCDSRAIIGGLLKYTNASNIKTFTYGVPGSFDYEIGKSLSKTLGIEHFEIDLSKQKYSMEMLLNTAKLFDYQTFLFFHPDYDILYKKFNDHIYWSGFLGDNIAGSHFPKWETEKMDINYIIERFLKKNTYVKSKYLASEPINTLSPLIDGQNIKIDNLTRYEIIDLFNRQTKYIAPHVCPNGLKVKAPFSTEQWITFICSVPQKYRRGLKLYEKILLDSFPELFAFPTKNNYGLSLKSSHVKILAKKMSFKVQKKLGFQEVINSKLRNYFDINTAIRNNVNIKNIMIENINDLTHRNILPWLNPNKILDDHLKSLADYGDAIQVLASLEIILKSKEL